MPVGGLAVLLAVVGTAAATHLVVDTEDHTTLEQILTAADPDADFKTLEPEQVDEDYVVRDPGGVGRSGREGRRRSLAYFSQLTDFQLADEESPARVEFLDEVAGQGGASSAWRPWEALTPFMIDDSIRQINRFVPDSPVPQGDGTGNPMDLAVITGDLADNQQRNEMIWTRALLEGGVTTNFNSGLTDPAAYSPENLPSPNCQAFVTQEGGQAQAAAEAAGYTGVQDYDDYPSRPRPPNFYDPNQPTGDWAAWPQYTGLLDRAQTLALTPAGLNVPSYWANGNHDVLVQGNEDANQAFETIATGCFKALGTTAVPGSFLALTLSIRASALPDRRGDAGPARPTRRFVSKVQMKAILGANDVAQRPRLQLRRPRRESGLERLGLLLRLESAADARRALHRHRHQLGGRHCRRRPAERFLEREPRPPPVSVAEERAAKRRAPGEADRDLRPPSRAQHGLGRSRRGHRRVHGRAAQPRRQPRARHQSRLRSRPAQLGAPALRESGAGRERRQATPRPSPSCWPSTRT